MINIMYLLYTIYYIINNKNMYFYQYEYILIYKI